MYQRTEYFTSEGEAITYDEATRIQDEIGLRPSAPPKYHPAAQTRFQVDDLTLKSTRFQDEIDPPPYEPEPLHGRCAYCHRPRLGPDAPYCGYHSPQGEAWQAAAADRTARYAQQGAD